MSKRNYGATPRPKGFKYARQPLSMPVAVAGVVRRGKIIGKDEETDMAKDETKHTHMVWHITEPSDKYPGHSRATANVSAPTQPDAVAKAKERFPHLKDKDIQANVVSSTAHTPPNYPASHHYELSRQDEMADGMKKNADALDKTNKALWDHQRGETPDFPLVGQDKAQATKLDARTPKINAPKTPAPKKPGSSITMNWLNEQKKLLTAKSEETDVEGLLWLFGTSEGIGELSKMMKDTQGESLAKKEHIARWESGSGKDWVDLHDHGDGSYSYSANGAGGVLGSLPSREHAVKQLQEKVDSGYFLPDKAKRPMKRVK